jgi:hypothetical protein
LINKRPFIFSLQQQYNKHIAAKKNQGGFAMKTFIDTKVQVNEKIYLGLISQELEIVDKIDVYVHWTEVLCRINDEYSSDLLDKNYNIPANYSFFHDSESQLLAAVDKYSEQYLNEERDKKLFAKLALEKYKQKDAIERYVKQKMAIGKNQRKILLPPPSYKQRYLITSIKFDTNNIYNSEISIRKGNRDIRIVKQEDGSVLLFDDFTPVAKNLFASVDLLIDSFKPEIIPTCVLEALPLTDIEKLFAVKNAVAKILQYRNLYSEIFIKDPINYPNALSEKWYFPNGVPKELPFGEPFVDAPFCLGALSTSNRWIWANEDDREAFLYEFNNFTAFK